MNKKSILWFVLGLLVAILAGIIWFLIVKYTGYEVGYVAVGVGFVVGFVLHHFMGNSRKTILLAIVLTIVGLFVAKGMIWFYIVPQSALEIVKLENPEKANELTIETMREQILKNYPIQEYFFDEINIKENKKNALLTLLFYFLALSTAYKTVAYDENKWEENEDDGNLDNDKK